MKNLNLLFLASFVLLVASCSKDEVAENNQLTTNNETILEIAIDSPDFSPKAAYDNSSEGLYHGVFSSRDFAHKGEIYINIANNGQFTAVVKLLNGRKVDFNLATDEFAPDMSNLKFVSRNSSISNQASFNLDASNPDSPIASNVTIAGKSAYIAAYKEKSFSRVMVALGTYIDSSDPAYTGNWDMVTGTETVASTFGVFKKITDVIIANPAGYEASDTDGVSELFNLCFDSGLEAFYDADSNTLVGHDQSVIVNGNEVFWSCTYSGGLYSDQACNPATSGTWSRAFDTRSGTFTLN